MAKINDPNAPRIARCSFCGKPQDQVRRLIAGNDAYICNECAELCQEIIREDFYSQDSFGTVKSVPKPTEIKAFLDDLIEKDRNASYLLIIEGQASKDNYSLNNQLSYDRALSLFKFWFPNQKETTLQFYNLPCEVVIAGAGYMEGKPRAERNADNQRFLIQIIPKPGIIDE